MYFDKDKLGQEPAEECGLRDTRLLTTAQLIGVVFGPEKVSAWRLDPNVDPDIEFVLGGVTLANDADVNYSEQCMTLKLEQASELVRLHRKALADGVAQFCTRCCRSREQGSMASDDQ